MRVVLDIAVFERNVEIDSKQDFFPLGLKDFQGCEFSYEDLQLILNLCL